MSVIIAGRTVVVNDALYHIGFRAWGVVDSFDPGGAAKLRITGTDGQSRLVYVTNGGNVAGARVIYWHAPLQLDLPYQDIGRYQAVLDTLVSEFPA